MKTLTKGQYDEIEERFAGMVSDNVHIPYKIYKYFANWLKTNSEYSTPKEWVLVHEDEIDGTELRMYAKEPIAPATISVRMQKVGEKFTAIKPFTVKETYGK